MGSASGRSTRTSSMSRSTGLASARRQSRRLSRASICTTARWCSTTCPRAMWRAAAASWRGSATTATARRASCRSSTACCAPPTVARWPLRCSRATPAIRARLRPRSTRSRSASRSSVWRLVGDRGMITQARLDAEITPAGLDWITALRAPAIRTLVEAGALQMSLFDQRDMAAITSPDYPGERLIVCRNPDLARERTRKREDLLAATEADLAVIAAAVRRARNPLHGEAEIALKVGAVVNRHKVAKHFELSIGEASFSFHRKTEAITAEAALDGIYVVRTNLPKKLLDDAATVGAYKNLARVERAFRSLKTVDIHLRPIFHWTTPRVRAHVLLCMLAYHVEHHMRARLAPMLYDETDHEAAAAMRASIVAKAERSEAARRKQTTGLTDDGLPVHSFQSLLADLATYARIQATTALNDKYVFTLHTRPTPIQQRAFELLALNPDRTQ